MLYISETYVNLTTEQTIATHGWRPAPTGDRRELFASLQRQHGRCVTRTAAGWVFTKGIRETHVDVREEG